MEWLTAPTLVVSPESGGRYPHHQRRRPLHRQLHATYRPLPGLLAMTHPLDTSDVYDALRQSIYDCLTGRVRPMSVVLHEAKQEAQDFHTAAAKRCPEATGTTDLCEVAS